MLVTPTPLPTGWESTVDPTATHVIVEAFAPTAFTSGEIAIVGVLLFGFALLVVLQVLILLRRTR